MAEASDLVHKHMANAPGRAVNDRYNPVYQLEPPARPTYPGPFQELPRLHVPPFALTPQAPAWKLPQEQPGLRMSVSHLLSGSARRQPPPSLPAPVPTPRRLPSLAAILARTNLLHLAGRSSPSTMAREVPLEKKGQWPEPAPAGHGPLYQPPYQPPYAMANRDVAPASPRVATFMHRNTLAARRDARQSPLGAASPVSPTSDLNKRRERWTDDEHARFMAGLNRYGRKWKKIQTFVTTKTAVQVRTHAYGFFAKLLRNMPEDDAIWELAEEMSSLPGSVLKGSGHGRRRHEPKTDEAGMDVLRRFVFAKKKGDDKKVGRSTSAAAQEDRDHVDMATSTSRDGTAQDVATCTSALPQDSTDQALDALLEIKRQRLK